MNCNDIKDVLSLFLHRICSEVTIGIVECKTHLAERIQGGHYEM